MSSIQILINNYQDKALWEKTYHFYKPTSQFYFPLPEVEETAFQIAIEDGSSYITAGGHLYFDINWIKDVYPNYYERYKLEILEFKMAMDLGILGGSETIH